MKNVIIVILLAATIVFGGLYFKNNHKAAQADAKLIALEMQVADLQAEIAQRDERAAGLREKLDRTQIESVANAGAAAQLSQALTNQIAAAGTNAKPANPFAEMFKNPEMRDMIKNQQKTVLGGMIDKNYADFFKSMNLTPEQQKAMKDLLLEKMLGGAELGMEMMGGDMDAEKRAELTKKMKEASDAMDQQLKDLLGADNYSEFKIYENSIGDRTLAGQLDEQVPLNASQKDLLVSAMADTRKDFKFTTDFGDQSNFSEDMMSRFTEDRINLYLQEQEQLNQRYLAAAQPILKADQYAAYQKLLKNQQEMTKMGMTMAAQMFGKKK